ncbi:prepilin cleavage protein [Acinetobacter harbinensis]|uniref:PilW family protein n=1 Tax=Acinetobacter harbinensis TaxID=1353941 RepID=UPI00057D5B27|nr:PilW family protein [Acinetobacter harbinensis]KWQ03902.1 prepilin cleavage protein [Acinetobacter harbinensis]
MRIYTKHRGFTLVELMISIVLGLLVSAIAIQLFLTSQRSVTVQQGMMNLQNSALFGFGTMIDNMRLANLNSSQPFINDKVLYGGVVLSANNISDNLSAFTIDEDLLTRGGIGKSNLDIKDADENVLGSDQLVIQYKVSIPHQFDCEGTGLTISDYVVERYFLRKDTNRNDPNEPLALACKAARYTAAEAKTNTTLNLTGNGEIVIPRVDHFSVRFGVAYDGANADCNSITTTKKVTKADGKEEDVTENLTADTRLDCFSYINIEDYRALTGEKPQIVSVQIGLLVRSTDTVGINPFFDANNFYKLLNTKAILKSNNRNNLYLRSVLTQTIAIRNGFGIE